MLKEIIEESLFMNDKSLISINNIPFNHFNNFIKTFLADIVNEENI